MYTHTYVHTGVFTDLSTPDRFLIEKPDYRHNHMIDKMK